MKEKTQKQNFRTHDAVNRKRIKNQFKQDSINPASILIAREENIRIVSKKYRTGINISLIGSFIVTRI